MLRKNEEVTGIITGYTSEGLGVLRAPDGQAVFVKDAVAGETARVRIEHIGHNAAYARIVRLETVSPHRVERECPLGKRCGGCDFWHLDYQEELRLKAQRVRDAFMRIGGFDPGEVPVLGAESCFGYRNKAQFPVAPGFDGPVAGFYRARSHQVLPVSRCLIQPESADYAKDAVLDWMRRFSVPAWDETRRQGTVRHVHVRTAAGQVLVCVVCAVWPPHTPELVDFVRAAVPELKSLVISLHSGHGNSVLGRELVTVWGDGWIEESLCGLRFRLSVRSFFQVNRAQAQRLYQIAVGFAGHAHVALDLFCGTGTISLCLARQVGFVYGVEIVEDAVRDARDNARRNGVRNVEFFCADAGDAAERFVCQGVSPEVVLVDPPRKGLDQDVVRAILRLAPDRVVYVSCDPATLARDVARFGGMYRVSEVRAVDMFPRCAHVETVVLLSKREIDSQKVRAELPVEDVLEFTKGVT